MTPLEALAANLRTVLGEALVSLKEEYGEITLVVRGADHVEAARRLRDDASLHFDTMIDLSGVDWRDWGEGAWEGLRFSVTLHLLSTEKNWRVRVHSFCPDDDFPVMASVTGIWPAAGWYEREAFDLYGIVFEGHADLRRILTDYGFVGHPFRKDFPVSGYVEMRYDPEQRRVIYQPVTIVPREIIPRVIREDGYGVVREVANPRGG